MMLASANRDERHFEDPDRFDIHRKPGGHLTFGRGAHFCVGAPLARLEGRIALEEVLNRFPEWQVDLTTPAGPAHPPCVAGTPCPRSLANAG